jgi:hypothetical protein
MKLDRLVPYFLAVAFVAFVAYVGYCFIHAHSPQADPNGYEIMAVFYVGMPLAIATTVTAFLALRRYRQKRFWIPLGFGLLPIVGFLVALVMLFPVVFVVAGGLGLATWGFVKWLRKRKWAKPGETIPTLAAEALSLDLSATAPIPVEPVAIEPEPSPVRGKKPVCGILTWALPLVAVPLGFLIAHVGDRLMDTEGFKGFGLMGLMFAPLFLALALSPVLAIVSLCRRERFPGLGIAALIVYALALAMAFPLGGLTPLSLVAAVILWLARRPFKKRKRRACKL